MDSPGQLPHLTGREFGEQLMEKWPSKRFPLSGQWELTCRCNLACVMCYTDPFNTPDHIRKELSYEEITRIMDELHEAGCMELCFTGGEPLARSDFLDIYSYAKGKGFLVSVFTNGTLVTKKITDYWAQYPPSMIEISFHGLTKGTFEAITQGHRSYEHCLLGIRLILERKLPLTLKTTGTTLNRDEVLKIKEYVSRLGDVRYKFGADIRPRLDGSEDVYQHQLPQEEIAAIEGADQEFRAERARQDRERAKARAEGQDFCRGGKYKFHIDAYGQLQLCSNNRERSYDLRGGSFLEGFYQVLPTFPCSSRQPGAAGELVSIESLTHRDKAEAKA